MTFILLMKLKLLMFIVATLALLSCTSRKEKAKSDFAKAVSEFYQSHYQLAKDLFTNCIDAGYNTSESYFYRGSTRFNLKDYNGAIEDLSMAIKVDSMYTDAWSTRGDIYTVLGKKEEGCRDWKKAESLGKPNMRDKVKYCN